MSRRGSTASDRVVAGLHPVRELLRAGVPVFAIHLAVRQRSPVLDELLSLARDAGVPVETAAASEELDRLSGGVTHQGVVAVAEAFPYRPLLELVPAEGPALLVALDGVTDPHNLGSIARTAEAVGAHGLVLPTDRSASVTTAVEKAAAGALAHLPVARVTNLARALAELGERGIWSVGLDSSGGTDVTDCELLVEPTVLVVGGEGRGLGRLVAERCDLLVRIPMLGRVDSLNASVAAAVALYAVLSSRTVDAQRMR